VTLQEYPGEKYPPYCNGWIVLYSSEVVFLLYREAQRTPYFWVDDVHVTGVLAARANLTHTSLIKLALSRKQVNQLVKSKKKGSKIGVFLFGSSQTSPLDIGRLWQLVQDRRPACT
jgi:hypothetical protein